MTLRNLLLGTAASAAFILGPALHAQKAILHPSLKASRDSAGSAGAAGSAAASGSSTPLSLTERWDWAKSEARTRDLDDGYWVGYSIERLMGERTFMGSWNSNPEKNRPALREVVAGMRLEFEPWDSPHASDDDEDDESKPEKKVTKEVGILFRTAPGDPGKIAEVEVSSMSLRVELDGQPLLWVGGANTDESLRLLTGLFDRAGSEPKESILMAIGMHGTDEAIDFLKKILLSDAGTEIRGTASFWLGQTGTEDARRILTDVAMKDESEDIREKCVFALNQIGSESATESLISIAKTHPSRETRKSAMFWLGQMTSKAVVGTLSDIAKNGDDYETQKSAVFALTQTSDKEGIDELISIANTHSDPRIRKDAIFWLSQSEDPRALDAIVAILKK